MARSQATSYSGRVTAAPQGGLTKRRPEGGDYGLILYSRATVVHLLCAVQSSFLDDSSLLPTFQEGAELQRKALFQNYIAKKSLIKGKWYTTNCQVNWRKYTSEKARKAKLSGTQSQIWPLPATGLPGEVPNFSLPQFPHL